jgi:hypothetical protein
MRNNEGKPQFESLGDLKNFNEVRIREVQDAHTILIMSSKDLLKQADSLNSAKKLKALFAKVVARNIEINQKTSQYAIEALTVANKSVKVLENIGKEDAPESDGVDLPEVTLGHSYVEGTEIPETVTTTTSTEEVDYHHMGV